MTLLQHNLTTDQILSGWQDDHWTAPGYLMLIFSAFNRDQGSVCIGDVAEFCKTWEISQRTFYRAKTSLISKGAITESPIQGLEIKAGDGNPIPEISRSLDALAIRDREAEAKGRPTVSEWRSLRSQVFKKDEYKCQYCGSEPKKLHCDHITPLSRGGGNEISNLITSCPPCNLSKSSKTPHEWLEVSNEVV